MNNKLIPYGKQWIDEEDIKAITEVFKTDWLTQGSKIEEFEKAIADYCGAKYGVAMSNGTAALHSAYVAAGVKPGDEIITSPITFAATANAAVFCGAKPVFADIEEDTLNIDPKEIEKKITNKTKVIAVIDFAGHPCDYDAIFKIAESNKLIVVEDACHALGSKYKGRKTGSFSDMTILSFHPVKTITTGEGGMVLTNNKDFYEKLKKFRHHGIVKKPEQGGWYYEIDNPGNNYRLTDFQCALGLSQLKKINKFIARRKDIVKRYNEAFGTLEEIIVPVEKDYADSSRHIYVIQLKLENLKADRKRIFECFHEQGIGVQVHYMPLHLHPFYQRNFGFKYGDFPKAERYYERAITLPLFPKMEDSEVERVIQTTKAIIKSYKK